MKMREVNFDDPSTRAVNRRGSTKRNRSSVEPQLAVDERRWPVVLIPQRNDFVTLEETIAKQSAELNLRCTQVADLYNIQQRQANELQTACEEIDRLSRTISMLVETAAQHESEAAAAKKKVAFLENERTDLRTQLHKALKESSELSRRLLAIETVFNDRETTIASTLEKVELLNAELIAAAAERFKLVAAGEGEKQRYRGELYQQKSTFESQIRKLESIAENQGKQISGLEEARDKLARRVDVLEILRNSEREAAELKIKQLSQELQRERQGHSAADRASAEMRKEIVFLLPKLEAQRNQPNAPEPGTDVPRNNAA
jgi:chromosome segregation ATPase